MPRDVVYFDHFGLRYVSNNYIMLITKLCHCKSIIIKYKLISKHAGGSYFVIW